jgi:hypothetical protein
VDALCYCLGEFTELTATTATRRPIVRLSGTDETIPMTAADQVAVTGVIEGGAVASLHYRGGLSRLIDINQNWYSVGLETSMHFLNHPLGF